MAEKHGWPFIEWFRPREAHLDRSRRLLATGRYADDPSSISGPGWEDENPVTEARLKDGKAGNQEKVSARVPGLSQRPAAIPPTASPLTAPPLTTPQPLHTPPQAEPSNTAQTIPITIPIPPLPTEPNPKPKTEPNTETKANPKKEATKPLPLAPKAGRSRKRAASAALREGNEGGAGAGDGAGRPAVRRSPRVRARSLSRE
ncbi:predicted protein [Chaetomium globosum CBS 148.51]|uniref:Uncharacterized protein n=1 Tax=Chaetomium globosum (strain ATCC 6205 / CBS 148.51 / DSM 1962 / NBRC 6347 / NRRL 1970) TaxID=306901 RepID=Q2HBE1_CHAGB|nr:uncharacterized protein CHGG_02463 [Chaetomium globosum CBS 148.51]EAQ90528.1 predicted protein [Chaetomium globosum CBS 148.51]